MKIEDRKNKSECEAIKKAIALKGFTLKEFAAHICVGYTTLVNALNGTQNLTPTLKNHIKLALGEEIREDYYLFKFRLTEADITIRDGDKLEVLREPSACNEVQALLLLQKFAQEKLKEHFPFHADFK